MSFVESDIEGVLKVDTSTYKDQRGMLRRLFCKRSLSEIGVNIDVKQGNLSVNPERYTLRGFHYQIEPTRESKILACCTGAVYNVVLDLRKCSTTYKQWVAIEISADRGGMIIVPEGCANAFITTEANTVVHYYMGDYFSPETYRGIRYDDPAFAVKWPCKPKVISQKDLSYSLFGED